MFKVNMGVKKGEKILVLTDYPERSHWIKMPSSQLMEN